MTQIKLLKQLPCVIVLTTALIKMEENDAPSVMALRKRTRHQPLRSIISGLWFSILYRAVQLQLQKGDSKDLRTQAIQNLMAHLHSGNELSPTDTKAASKRMRSGAASWMTFSEEPGLLAIIDFSNPPSETDRHNLGVILKGNTLRQSSKGYRRAIRNSVRRVLSFIRKILRTTPALYRYLERALDQMDSVLDSIIHDPTGTFCISLETTFNKSTHLRHIVPYDSEILIRIQSGDTSGTLELLKGGMASIYDVDPYNLGLLYYAGYYCWRSYGATKAIQMCTMLLQMGADVNISDEIGNTPLETMVDSALADQYIDPTRQALARVASFCKTTSFELIEEHRTSCGLTPLHETLLGINQSYSGLEQHLQWLRRDGSLSELIDEPDFRGRTALAWAVEYGMADAVRTLLNFGSNPCQYRTSDRSRTPMLHLAIAGPPPPLESGLFEVVKMFLATDIDINARDEEGWTAFHIASSWRSYDILHEIMRTHFYYVDIAGKTNLDELADDLSQDADFYPKLLMNTY